MVRKTKPRRPLFGGLLRLMVKLGLLSALWLAGVAAHILWVGERDEAAPADAIVVLDPRRGLAGKLIFTGGYGGSRARFSESQVARRYALREGIPGADILIESRSRTTYENLVEAREVMLDNQLSRVIVVSDPLHMARALRLSRELGINAVGSPTPNSRFRSWRTRWEFLAREVYFFHRDLLTKRR
jgi:uncharacterized SAM-binding protein YcdF (DUF218 family)